jgi:sulfatase modifying factor 1
MGPEKGTQKAYRDDDWMWIARPPCGAAMRNGTNPGTKINWLGFRCAQSMQEAAGTQVS